MQKELGSSPRGRGKLFTKVPVPAIMGLIPAWAGKTDWRTFESMRRRAHPRVGGENLSRPRGWGKSPGSSPRGRGKPHGARSGIPRDGLIPAWAGKTSSSASPRPPSRAHPRVGGENGNGPTAGNPMYGSSPRGRGKLILPCELRYMFGLIPAWAGKTWSSQLELSKPSAHPRVGGENAFRPLRTLVVRGSSPRGRGKLPPTSQRHACPGLIPAWAGKTISCHWSATASPAHPRVGGENCSVESGVLVDGGSSPRGRGKRLVRRDHRAPDRLIPAWAGKTTPNPSPQQPARAHPRVGGENHAYLCDQETLTGSSPRGRGKPLIDRYSVIILRLIPAWAGKTDFRYLHGYAHQGSSPRGRGKRLSTMSGT